MKTELAFLTDEELSYIAAPLTRPAAITRWLERQGFKVKKRPNGRPLISRDHFHRVMNGREAEKNEPGDGREETPDVNALMRRFEKQAKQSNGTKT